MQVKLPLSCWHHGDDIELDSALDVLGRQLYCTAFTLRLLADTEDAPLLLCLAAKMITSRRLCLPRCSLRCANIMSPRYYIQLLNICQAAVAVIQALTERNVS
jgi:hypothetical protein